jgi:hypothetical protein
VKQKHPRTASLSCRIVSARKDLGQAAVAPGCYEEIKEKDNDNCKKLRKVSIFQVEINRNFQWK